MKKVNNQINVQKKNYLQKKVGIIPTCKKGADDADLS